MSDSVIFVRDLQLQCHIGATDAERSLPQKLTADLRLEPVHAFHQLDDRLENTVDYARVCDTVRELAAARPRRLIETLASDIADALLAKFALKAVEVEVHKYVVPHTNRVAVRLRREAT